MIEIDSAAFEAGVSPCNFTAGRIDSADESDAAHFSAALGRIYITAQALLLSARPQAGHTQPSLTLVVEDSADGSSWATVATFDFTASDQQSAAVDSPRAYLRASWADVVGTWAVDVAVKSIATPASGGGSMPGIPLAAGPAWAPGGAVAEGYQITASYLGQSRVWEATSSGTTTDDGSVFPDDYSPSLDPLAITSEGVFWRYLGIVGEISYQYLPAAGIVVESGYYSGGGGGIVDPGAREFLAWDVFDSGDDVLDLSVPAHPVARKEGVFFVSAEVQVVLSHTDVGLTLMFDYTDAAVPIGGGGTGFANVNGSYRVPAGGQIRLQAFNDDADAHDIKIINAHVSRVGPG